MQSYNQAMKQDATHSRRIEILNKIVAGLTHQTREYHAEIKFDPELKSLLTEDVAHIKNIYQALKILNVHEDRKQINYLTKLFISVFYAKKLKEAYIELDNDLMKFPGTSNLENDEIIAVINYQLDKIKSSNLEIIESLIFVPSEIIDTILMDKTLQAQHNNELENKDKHILSIIVSIEKKLIALIHQQKIPPISETITLKLYSYNNLLNDRNVNPLILDYLSNIDINAVQDHTQYQLDLIKVNQIILTQDILDALLKHPQYAAKIAKGLRYIFKSNTPITPVIINFLTSHAKYADDLGFAYYVFKECDVTITPELLSILTQNQHIAYKIAMRALRNDTDIITIDIINSIVKNIQNKPNTEHHNTQDSGIKFN